MRPAAHTAVPSAYSWSSVFQNKGRHQYLEAATSPPGRVPRGSPWAPAAAAVRPPALLGRTGTPLPAFHKGLQLPVCPARVQAHLFRESPELSHLRQGKPRHGVDAQGGDTLFPLCSEKSEKLSFLLSPLSLSFSEITAT